MDGAYLHEIIDRLNQTERALIKANARTRADVVSCTVAVGVLFLTQLWQWSGGAWNGWVVGAAILGMLIVPGWYRISARKEEEAQAPAPVGRYVSPEEIQRDLDRKRRRAA